MRGFNSVLATLILSSPVFLAISQAQSAQRENDEEEYKVYSAVIEAISQDNGAKKFVIVKTTSPYMLVMPELSYWQDFLSELSPLSNETLTNYHERNRSSIELVNKFNVNIKIVLIDEEFAVGWRRHFQHFPESSGYYTFSNVGFDSLKTQALVFVSLNCGPLCGDGTCYFLIKENGKWEIEQKRVILVF